MKFLYLAALFLLPCIIICKANNFKNINSINAGRDTLSGKVTDAGTGSTLAGASVYIPDLKMSVVADSNGNYHFNNLPHGAYVIEVSCIGYKSFLKTVSLKENTVVDFSLKSSAIEESEVVVTGTSRATSVLRNPVPVIAINKQYLVQNASTNIIDAIAKVPGVNAITTGPNIYKP